MTSYEEVPSKATVTKILGMTRYENHRGVFEAIIDGKQEALKTFGIRNCRFDHQYALYSHLQQQGLNGKILPACYGPVTIDPNCFPEAFAAINNNSSQINPQAIRLEFFPNSTLKLSNYFIGICQDRKKQVEQLLYGYLQRLHRAGLAHGLIYDHPFVLVPDGEGKVSIRMIDLSASRTRQSVSASEWKRMVENDYGDLKSIFKDLRAQQEAFRVAGLVESSKSLDSGLQEEIVDSKVLGGTKWYTQRLVFIILGSITEPILKLGVQLVQFLMNNYHTDRGAELAQKLISTYEQSKDVRSITILRYELVKLVPWNMQLLQRRLIQDTALQTLRGSLGPYDKVTLQCRQNSIEQLTSYGEPGRAQYILWKDLRELTKLYLQSGGDDNDNGKRAAIEKAFDKTFYEFADALAQDWTGARMWWWVRAQVDWLLPGVAKIIGARQRKQEELKRPAAGNEKKRKVEEVGCPVGTEKTMRLAKLMEVVANETWS